jgi:thymidylate kinase
VRIIALEGPSFSGKTTAIAALAKDPSLGRTAVFDCYVREIARPGDIPPARTTDRAQQVAAFRTFMAVEARRTRRLQHQAAQQDAPALVILDRSVDTLLAHAHALDTLYGFGARAIVAALLPDLPHLVPEHTFYLDTDGETLRARRAAAEGGSGSGDFVLHDPGFLAAWREYFLGGAGPTLTPTVTAVSADPPPAQVAARIRGLL